MKQGWRLRWLGLATGLALLVGAGGLAGAATDVSGGLPRSYNAAPDIQTGMIVALDSKDSGRVVPLTIKSIDDMFGVVVPIGDATISLGADSATNRQAQVLVAKSDQHNVLVSNQNGSIKKGDYITISSLAGIGMKADANQDKVVGRAEANFNGTDNVASTATLKGSLGHSTTVSIGRIAVGIAIAPNPLNENSNNIRGFLTRTANGFANKPVSQIRVYLSTAILLGTLFATGNMLYGAVRNGVLAIGRNPLAQKSIVRSLVQVVGLSLGVFAAGILAVYVILNY